MTIKKNKATMEVNLSGVFTTGLALMFIFLKLTGNITWSWLWVLAPLWIPASIMIVAIAVYVGVNWNKI